MLLIVAFAGEPFLAFSTPIAVLSSVILVMLLQSTSAFETLLALRTVVFSRHWIDEVEQIVTEYSLPPFCRLHVQPGMVLKWANHLQTFFWVCIIFL